MWNHPPAGRSDRAPGDVDVWKADLDPAARRVADLERTLSEQEQVRARRFAFPDLRRRFVVCRAVLRVLLGDYLGVAPHRVEFGYGPHGKPVLAGRPDEPVLRFNVSHSDDLALYAITVGREVGIDVERIRPDLATLEIAARFFSPGELAALRATDPTARARAFFECWTRKEAYIKARGEGLSFPLHRFEVSIGDPAALLAVHDDPEQVSRWTLEALDPGPGFAAALVVEGPGRRVRCWQWPDLESPENHARARS